MKTTILMIALLGLTACSGPSAEATQPTGPDIEAELASIEADTGILAPAEDPLTELTEEVVAEIVTEPVAPAPGTVRHEITLQDGENLSLLAAWAGVTAEDIAEASGISVTARLMPGQALQIPMSTESAEGFETRRGDALAARVQRYLDRRGGEMSLAAHTVRTGESAWSIARETLSLPTWVLAFYNPGVDMERLQIGQALSYPAFAPALAVEELAVEPSEEQLAQ